MMDIFSARESYTLQWKVLNINLYWKYGCRERISCTKCKIKVDIVIKIYRSFLFLITESSLPFSSFSVLWLFFFTSSASFILSKNVFSNHQCSVTGYKLAQTYIYFAGKGDYPTCNNKIDWTFFFFLFIKTFH